MDVNARCRRCTHEQTLAAEQLVVALPRDSGRHPAYVVFTCASCQSSPAHQVPPGVAAALVAQGAAWLPTRDVSALDRRHPESPDPDAAPLTHDDLLDLHEHLADDAHVRTLLTEQPGPPIRRQGAAPPHGGS
jgi:hypothetical protein